MRFSIYVLLKRLKIVRSDVGFINAGTPHICICL
jgi:hypothetical protein